MNTTGHRRVEVSDAVLTAVLECRCNTNSSSAGTSVMLGNSVGVSYDQNVNVFDMILATALEY